MIFDWYKIFNLTEFLSTGLASREIIVLLETLGRSSILISRGNLVTITFNDVSLPVNYPGVKPYVEAGLAAYVDGSQNVWLGVEVVP